MSGRAERERNEERIALEPQLNRILQVWLAQEKNINLQWTNTDSLNWNTISAETKSALSGWIESDSNLDNTQVVTIPDKEFLQKYKFSNIIELYNYYYCMYNKLIENNNNVIFIDYRKIIDKSTAFQKMVGLAPDILATLNSKP